ncbi:MAG: allophanate hydrolase subunit 1 [Rhizobiales bacterium]|nr:allophanate hydrolase subunit 1 [Hyphomicrobiales bacterium]
MDYPRLLNAGETALVVEYGATVDPGINDRVLALDAAFATLALPGVSETVPTYRSLMIHYDPLVIDRDTLAATIGEIETTLAPTGKAAASWTMPCCYDPDFGEDIAAVAQATGLTPERVVSLHSGATYRVYMYGFAPGFSYLGGLPPELAVSRRITPRPPHPPNTVLIGGGLALVSTFSMPTGWWLIGRTPERMFSLARDPAFLVAVGDTLRFEAVDRDTFDRLEARAEAGEIVSRKVTA